MREILSMAASDAPDANPLFDKASLQPFPPTPADAAVAAAATRTHDPTARHDVKESPPALAWRLRLPSSHRRRVREKKIRRKTLPAGRPLTGHCDSTAPPAHHPHVSFFFFSAPSSPYPVSTRCDWQRRRWHEGACRFRLRTYNARSPLSASPHSPAGVTGVDVVVRAVRTRAPVRGKAGKARGRAGWSIGGREREYVRE